MGPGPKGTVLGFASASSLLRQAYPEEGSRSPRIPVRAELAEKKNQQSCDKPASKRKKAAVRREEEEGIVSKKPRAPRKKVTVRDSSNETPIEANKPHAAERVEASEAHVVEKSRTKRRKDEAQTKIKKTKITKPGAIKDTAKATKTAKTPKSNKVKETEESGSVALIKKKEASEASTEPLNLERAVKRRRDWTPTKDTSLNLTRLVDNKVLSDISITIQTPLKNNLPASQFGNVLGDFGYVQPSHSSMPAPAILRDVNGKGSTKRRKVELLNTTICPPLQPVKAKRSTSPKKKPQTITEKATAPFAPPAPQITSPLLQHLAASEPQSNTDAGPLNLASTSDREKQRKSPVRKVRKPKAATTKVKKQTFKAPILLSPESAIKTAKDQELVFGTCSQLESEESPTFIRDLRKAIEVSETMAKPIITSPTISKSTGIMSGSSTKTNVASYVASRNLWSVASRDSGGSLLHAEVVNLVDSPLPRQMRMAEGVSPLSKPVSLDVYVASVEAEVEWNVPEDLFGPREKGLERPSIVEQDTATTERSIPKPVAEESLNGRLRSRSLVKKTRKNAVPLKPGASAAKSLPEGMPNYQGFTTTDLAKAVASYAFKPIKKREGMIDLLERCWESKNRIALQPLPPNINVPQPPTAEAMTLEALKQSSSPQKKGRPPRATIPVTTEVAAAFNPPAKKPRGRPRKASTDAPSPRQRPTTSSRKAPPLTKPRRSSTPAPVDEISDSDSIPPTPSPPRRRSSKTPSTLPLSPAKPKIILPTTVTPSFSSSPDILHSITLAITSHPPTHNPLNLTYHEKILMYEPLVIEDLTRWLNEGGLGRVGVDEEVGVGKVREWCEGGSVCWVWKGGWRGNRVGKE